ncbi:MAG: MFS transporter [Bacteroidota bacterium]
MAFSLIKMYRDAFSGLSREIWLLSGAIFINRAGSMVIPFLSLYLTESQGFSLVEAGWILSCFGGGSILGSWLGGRLTDRLGYYPVMVASLAGSAFMFWVLMQLSGFIPLCIGIFMVSVITDSFRPANYVAIDAYTKPENRTRSIGLVRFAINLGFSAGPAVGGWLIYSLGYKWLFFLDGATCLGAAIWLWIALSPKTAPDKSDDNKSDKAPEKPTGFASPWQDRVFLGFLLAQLLVSIAFIQNFNTAPLFFKSEMGMDEFEIGMLIGLNGVLIVLFEMPLIHYFESKRSPISMVRIGTLLLTASFAFLLWPDAGILIAVVYMVWLTFGEMVNFPFGNTFVLFRTREDNRGRYMGLYSMIWSVCHIIGPSLGTWLAETIGFRGLWACMTVLCLLSLVFIWRVPSTMPETAKSEKVNV